MAILKESVRMFMDKLCGTRRGEVQKEIDAFYEEHLDPTFNAVIKDLVGDIPTYAERILASLELHKEGIIALGGVNEQNMNNFIGVLNTRGLCLSGTIRTHARSGIIYVIEHPYGGAFDYSSTDMNALVDRLQKSTVLTDMLKRRADIDTLRGELHNTIDSCRSGKQAHEMMVRLGVDMDAYMEPLSNLPTIVKLSANVCLLNGTC